MEPKKSGFLSWLVVLTSVFAPFLVMASALILLPRGVYVGKSPDTMDWMWLIFLAGMMLGIYFLTLYVAFHTFERYRRERDQDRLHPR